MKRDLIRIGIVIGVFIAIAGGWFLLGGGAEGAAEGQRAPEFTLETYVPPAEGDPEAGDDGEGDAGPVGELVNLADLQGKPVFLNMWASWCDPCRWEMPFVKEIQEERPDVHVYAINIGESAEKVQNFLQEENLDGLNILMDKKFEIYDGYELTGLPVSLFLNEEGVICTRYSGAMTLEMMEAALSGAEGEC